MKIRFSELGQGVVTFLIGLAVGATLCALGFHLQDISITWTVPIADLATVIIGFIAIALAPALLSRLERQGAFDRQALTRHLEPARVRALEVPEILVTLGSDALDTDTRSKLIAILRALRSDIELAQRIATKWKWKQAFVAELEHARDLAARLNTAATGDAPFSKRVVANEIARQLHDSLLELLRSCSI